MTDPRLSAFVATILRAKRIRFGDVRRLARDVLPRGIRDRATAETLLALDRSIDKVDPTWTEFVVAELSSFLAATREATAGGWLEAALGSRPTRRGQAILSEMQLTSALRPCRHLESVKADPQGANGFPGSPRRPTRSADLSIDPVSGCCTDLVDVGRPAASG